jgi:hypothetical protein
MKSVIFASLMAVTTMVQANSCKVDYTCGGTPHNNVSDTSMTVVFLGLTLLGIELSRRRLVPARVQK